MTELTNQQLEDASRRAATKLQAFCDGLAEDERLVFRLAIRRFIAAEGADTQGYSLNSRDIPYRTIGSTLRAELYVETMQFTYAHGSRT